MICLAVTYVMKPGTEESTERRLRLMTESTRSEPGCRFYLTHRSTGEPRKFFLYEQYDDQAALAAHRATDYFIEHILGGLIPDAETRSPEFYEPLTT
jgi:autoinducer 2-degrading protein